MKIPRLDVPEGYMTALNLSPNANLVLELISAARRTYEHFSEGPLSVDEEFALYELQQAVMNLEHDIFHAVPMTDEIKARVKELEKEYGQTGRDNNQD